MVQYDSRWVKMTHDDQMTQAKNVATGPYKKISRSTCQKRSTSEVLSLVLSSQPAQHNRTNLVWWIWMVWICQGWCFLSNFTVSFFVYPLDIQPWLTSPRSTHSLSAFATTRFDWKISYPKTSSDGHRVSSEESFLSLMSPNKAGCSDKTTGCLYMLDPKVKRLRYITVKTTP